MALIKINNRSSEDNAIHGRRNLIYNGAMNVAQRGTSVTGISSTGSYYTMDRWIWYQSGSTTWNLSQSTVSPDGFAYSYKVEVNNAVASPSASDYAIISQVFEGQDLQHLDWATSGAKSVTLSFWVRSSITGKFYVELDQSSRWNDVSYTINAADTWEYKTLTFTGDTSVGPDNDNSAELYLYFWFLAGSDWAGGTTTENVWHQTNNADRVVGQTNLGASGGDVVYITGVQLEVGDTATPFEHRSYGEELALCQRYYETDMPESGSDTRYSMNMNSVAYHYTQESFQVTKRAVPTITVNQTYNDNLTISVSTGTTSRHHAGFAASNGGTVNARCLAEFNWTADAEL